MVDVEHDDVARRPLDRGYAAATTDAVVDDVTAAAYEAVLDDVLDLAGLELTVRRLAAEISRTRKEATMIWIVLEVVAVLVIVLSLVVVSAVLLPTRRTNRARLTQPAARGATQQDRRSPTGRRPYTS